MSVFFVKPEVRGILMEAVGRNEQKKRPNPYDQKRNRIMEAQESE